MVITLANGEVQNCFFFHNLRFDHDTLHRRSRIFSAQVWPTASFYSLGFEKLHPFSAMELHLSYPMRVLSVTCSDFWDTDEVRLLSEARRPPRDNAINPNQK